MAQLMPYIRWIKAIDHLCSGGWIGPESGHRILPQFALTAESQSYRDAALRGEKATPASIASAKGIVDQFRQQRNALAKAHKFVVPSEFSVVEHMGGEDRAFGENNLSLFREVYERNPHLPYPLIYVQIPVNSMWVRRDSFEALDYKRTNDIFTYCVDGRTTPWKFYMGTWHGGDATTDDSFSLMPAFSVIRKTEDGVREGIVQIYDGFDWEGINDVNVRLKVTETFKGVMTVATNTLMCVLDTINNYRPEIVESPGLRRLPAKKLGKRDRIAHSIVKLGKPYYRQLRDEDEERERVRMRRHEVRGHWRHYKNGRRKWIERHERGDASLGRVVKEYDLPGNDDSTVEVLVTPDNAVDVLVESARDINRRGQDHGTKQTGT